MPRTHGGLDFRSNPWRNEGSPPASAGERAWHAGCVDRSIIFFECRYEKGGPMTRHGIVELGVAGVLLLLAAPLLAQQVTLPLGRYDELRARANPASVPPSPPPAPFALEADELRIAAGPSAARVVQTLTLTLYAAGWQSVPLGASGSFVAARLGGLEGRVVTAADGASLVVRGSGRHRVELESVLPVARDETATLPTWKLALRPPAAAVVRGRLRAPAGVEVLEVDDGPTGSGGGSGVVGVVERQADGSWDLVAAPGAALGLTLRGRAASPARVALPLRFEATAATATVVSRTETQVRSWIEARVAQGSLERLTVPLPPGLTLVGVSGPVAGWKVEDGRIVITPLAPVETAITIEIDLTGAPTNSFASPVLAPDGSARTQVFTRDALRGDGILDLAAPGAARAADEAEAARLPADFRQAPGRLFALPDPRRPPRWAIAWAERTEVLASEVDRLRVDILVGESGRASYQLWAEVRNRGAEQLAFRFPAGFELVAALRDGVAIAPGVPAASAPPAGGGAAAPAADRVLAVPLAATGRAQVVFLQGVLPLAMPDARGGRGDLALPLPALSAPAARIEVRALLPGGRTYTLADAARASVVASPPSFAVVAPGADAAAPGAFGGLARQVQAAAPPATAEPLARPAGFAEVDAVWSALSSSAAPLIVHVQSGKERPSWF
jgi:hypothetical protein